MSDALTREQVVEITEENPVYSNKLALLRQTDAALRAKVEAMERQFTGCKEEVVNLAADTLTLAAHVYTEEGIFTMENGESYDTAKGMPYGTLTAQLQYFKNAYEKLVPFYDQQGGTPCEQIRHQHEIDELKQQLATVAQERDTLRASHTAMEEALKLLCTAMETGHYKSFSFTLKNSYCPKCNTDWPCGEFVKAQQVLARRPA